jgi:hypothetical protein
MSDTDRTSEFLAHNGVKGMKWGVIREKAAAGNRGAQKKLAKADAHWEKKVSSSFPFEVHNAAANKMNNGAIEKLNNDPRFKDKDLSDPSKPLTQKYYKTYSDMFTKALNEAVPEHGGVSPSGKSKLKMDFDLDNGLSWKIEES